MKYNVLVLLLGMTFSSLNVSAQTLTYTDEINHIVYSYDKSAIVVADEGEIDSNNPLNCDVSFTIKNGIPTTSTVTIGTSTTSGQKKTYGQKLKNAVWKVDVTPTTLKSGTNVNLVTTSGSIPASASDVLVSSHEGTSTIKSTQNALMTQTIASIFVDPTSAEQEGYVYTSDRLKAFLGDDFSSTKTLNGKALKEGACYVFYTEYDDENDDWIEGYVQVSKLTVFPYEVKNTVTGTMYYNPTTVPSNFIADNTNVTSVSLGATVTTIGDAAFKGCKSLSSFSNASTSFKIVPVTVWKDNQSTTYNLLCNSTGSEIIAAPSTMEGKDTLDTSVTSVRDYAFYNVSANSRNLIEYYKDALSYTDTHGSSVSFIKLKDETEGLTTEFVTVDGVQVGAILTGNTSYADLDAELINGLYDALSYVDMRGVHITDGSTIESYPLPNQIYIFGHVNGNGSDSNNVDVTIPNVVYTDTDGSLKCDEYDLYTESTLNRNVYIPEDFKAANATIADRSFTSGSYQSLIMPFVYDKFPSGLTAYYFKSYNTSTKKYRVGQVGLNGVNYAANVPYLVTGSGSLTGSATVKATTSLSYTTDDMNGMTVTGVYNYRTGDQFDINNNDGNGRDYFFATNGGVLTFGEKTHLDAFRAYIHLPSEYLSSAKGILGFDDVETGVDEISQNDTQSEYFTTSGTKMQSQSKGVNLIRVKNSDGSYKVEKKVIK